MCTHLIFLTPEGLLERCFSSVAVQSQELLQEIPDPWRRRVKLVSESRARAAAPRAKQPPGSMAKRLSDLGQSDLHYKPLVVEPIDGTVVPKRSNPNQTSYRIPAAMAVDPYIRALAQANGMRVTENAVWLLVIAMKEYVTAILRNCISAKNMIEAGEPPPLFPLVRQRVLHKKREIGDHKSELLGIKGPNPEGGQPNCVTAHDVHMLASGMSVGNPRSIGGSVSRIAFERSLFCSSSTPLTPGGAGYEEVRQFISSKLEVPPSRAKEKPLEANEKSSIKYVMVPLVASTSATPVSPSTSGTAAAAASATAPVLSTSQPQEDLDRSKSPRMGGMGRGAKDLAALKARASFSTKNSPQGIGEGANADNPPTALAAAAAAAAAATTGSYSQEPYASQPSMEVAPSSPVSRSDVNRGPDQMGLSPPTPSATVGSSETTNDNAAQPTSAQKAHSIRIGMGRGSKNLAAMRARSITKKDDDPKSPADGSKPSSPESSTTTAPAQAGSNAEAGGGSTPAAPLQPSTEPATADVEAGRSSSETPAIAPSIPPPPGSEAAGSASADPEKSIVPPPEAADNTETDKLAAEDETGGKSTSATPEASAPPPVSAAEVGDAKAEAAGSSSAPPATGTAAKEEESSGAAAPAPAPAAGSTAAAAVDDAEASSPPTKEEASVPPEGDDDSPQSKQEETTKE